VSILRLQSLVHFAKSTNPTWDQWDVANWSTIEVNVGLICLCMPSIRVILVRLFPRILGSSNRSMAYANGNTSALGNMQSSREAQVAPKNGRGIVYSRSYTVEYDQRYNDQSRLVRMAELDAAVYAKTESKDSISHV
jgi:hypothetical protein